MNVYINESFEEELFCEFDDYNVLDEQADEEYEQYPMLSDDSEENDDSSVFMQGYSADKEFDDGEMHIAQGCTYSLDDRRTHLNNNVLIVGGSGTGKTSTVVIPNILQAVGSYVISDPKGSLYRKYGEYLYDKGYNVFNIDFVHPEISHKYNPLSYVRSTQDIMKIASIIINEKASEGTSADPFWDSMAMILLTSIITYMIETDYRPFNFSGILNLIREGQRSDEDKKRSKLSERFHRHQKLNPDSRACAMFSDVDQAPTRTFDCIRATLCSKMSMFDTDALQEMMKENDFPFEVIGTQKTAVFVTVSDTDRSLDPLANIFFTQAIQQMCSLADSRDSGRLSVPVRFILDDFATNCRIEEFPRMISSIRSRGISVMLMIQAESQLSQSYEDDRMTIIANCDTYVYLGGNDYDTAGAVALRCNKPVSKVLYMPVGTCWVFRRGSQPVFTQTIPHDNILCLQQKQHSA